jgi:hypothetical protein
MNVKVNSVLSTRYPPPNKHIIIPKLPNKLKNLVPIAFSSSSTISPPKAITGEPVKSFPISNTINENDVYKKEKGGRRWIIHKPPLKC